MFGAKVQIAALEKDIEFELVMVPFDSVRRLRTQNIPRCCASTRSARCPCSWTAISRSSIRPQIFEISKICKPHSGAVAGGAAGPARARGLEHQSDEVYFLHIIRLMGLQQDLKGEVARAAIGAASRFCVEMERRLESSDWLAGTFHMADIAFYMAALFGERQGAPLGRETPRLLAWRDRMSKRKPVQAVVYAMAAWLKAAGRPVPAFMEA